MSELPIEKGSVMDVSEDTKLAVKKGVAWLDEHYPEWLDAIDLNELEMANVSTCILGQTEGDANSLHGDGFIMALDRHGLSGDDAAELGFDRKWNEGVPASKWVELQTAWEDKIKELRDE